jgi:hypothetical protein
MKRFLRTTAIMIITFIIIIAIFWLVLPATGIAEKLGTAYIFVALIGSLVISYFVSWFLSRIFQGRRK